MAPILFAPMLASFSYTGIFIWFLIFDNFVPILEELALISIGYFSALGVFNPIIAIFVAVVALGMVDNIVYFLALGGSKHLKFVDKMMNHSLVIKYQMRMKQDFNKTFTFLTFTPKIRFFAPILAGTTKTRWQKFLLVDFLSLSGFVLVYFFVGFLFYKETANVFSYLQNWRHLIFVGFVVTLLIASFFVARWAKKKYKI